MNPALIGSLATIAGALVTGVIALLLMRMQVRHQRALEREKRQLERCEQIHRTLSTVERLCQSVASNLLAHIANGVPLKLDPAYEARAPIDELEMLADFYAPPLRPTINDIASAFHQLQLAVAKVIQTSDDGVRVTTGMEAARLSKQIAAKAESAQAELVRLATIAGLVALGPRTSWWPSRRQRAGQRAV